ncbi:ferredoxin [Capsulimonas corticalis]|uniref:Ferredoxin n=1 Tax=Capsulimonas corticalis TaxID=2219043 RepID=A0A402CY74_9BACT|nr:(2Fe-2S) ferredoxin domain-containing protein [Capsulimonas corticalis]BDI31433.1 ferredoxin [Capsulimonas corticalis]
MTPNSHNVRYHFLICGNTRPSDSLLPSCGPQGGSAIADAFRQGVARRGWPAGVKVTATGCLTPCLLGPNLVVYPEGTWYSGVTVSDVEEIIAAHLDHGAVVERLRMPAEARLW